MIRALAAAFLVLVAAAAAGAQTRVKDIVSIQGVRVNQLVGYGLVIGLQGSGDSMRNSPFTEQALQSMLEQMGVSVRSAAPRSRNIAAVIATAELPAFIGEGSRIDVTVSSLGDATSLAGGTLVMTPLSGADGQVYAVAQGALAVTGFSTGGQAESLSQGVPTAGRIPNGALVERRPPGYFGEAGPLVMELRNPDFNTAIRVVDAINAYGEQRFGRAVARETDHRTIMLDRPDDVSTTRFIAEIGNLTIRPDNAARIVIDERSGTIVIGSEVTISTVAVTHGNLTVRISETPTVSQPEPFSLGETTVAPETFVEAAQSGGQLAIVEGSNLQTLVGGLNQIGLKPNGIIAILQAIKSAGALQAELVVQ